MKERIEKLIAEYREILEYQQCRIEGLKPKTRSDNTLKNSAFIVKIEDEIAIYEKLKHDLESLLTYL